MTCALGIVLADYHHQVPNHSYRQTLPVHQKTTDLSKSRKETIRKKKDCRNGQNEIKRRRKRRRCLKDGNGRGNSKGWMRDFYLHEVGRRVAGWGHPPLGRGCPPEGGRASDLSQSHK